MTVSGIAYLGFANTERVVLRIMVVVFAVEAIRGVTNPLRILLADTIAQFTIGFVDMIHLGLLATITARMMLGTFHCKSPRNSLEFMVAFLLFYLLPLKRLKLVFSHWAVPNPLLPSLYFLVFFGREGKGRRGRGVGDELKSVGLLWSAGVANIRPGNCVR